MKQAYKTMYLVAVLIMAVSLKALAIDDDGGLGSDVPVDGGLSLLVAAGAGYGVKKARHFKKK